MEALLMHVIGKKMAEEMNKQLVNKLAQLQFGEAAKQKKDQDEKQVPVMTPKPNNTRATTTTQTCPCDHCRERIPKSP